MAQKITRIIRNSLFALVNKEFLVFLFFLAVSGFFWLLITLNETVESEIQIPVSLVNLPRNVVITGEMEDTIRVTVRDKGYTLATYLYGNRVRPIAVNFQSYAKTSGKGTVTASDLLKVVYQQLYGSTRIVSVKPDHLEFYYNYGRNKSVPVQLKGQFSAGENYYLTHRVVMPDSVIVYASQELLDSIHAVETVPLVIRDITDTVKTEAKLKPIKGAKIVPATVRVALYPDVLTEKVVEVPITAINMPADKVLRTFPARAKVRFAIGATKFRTVDERAFRVIADYKELMEHPSDKCTLHLISSPSVASKPRLEIEQVDYLIEQQ